MSIAQPTTHLAEEYSDDDLKQYRGCWVAFSPDGRRIVAAERLLSKLDRFVQDAGENPEEVLLEFIPDGDCIRSGRDIA